MKTSDINLSLYIFRLRKYDRIIGKNLEHETYGVKDSPWTSKFMLVFFFFMTNLSSYNNIFEAET